MELHASFCQVLATLDSDNLLGHRRTVYSTVLPLAENRPYTAPTSSEINSLQDHRILKFCTRSKAARPCQLVLKKEKLLR